MRYAIGVWYMVSQNEPSRPNEELLKLPDDVAERDAILREEYLAGCGEEEEDVGEIVISEAPSHYGDIRVAEQDSDVILFVTFCEIPK